MKLVSKISPRKGVRDITNPYSLEIWVLDQDEYPTAFIFSQEGEVTWSGNSSRYTFSGSYESCLKKEQEVLKKVEDFLRAWEQNFPFPERVKTYAFNGRGFEEEEDC